jgi:hypothetical protein
MDQFPYLLSFLYLPCAFLLYSYLQLLHFHPP